MLKTKKFLKELYTENDLLSALIILNLFRILEMQVLSYKPALGDIPIFHTLRSVAIYSTAYFCHKHLSSYLKKYTVKSLIKLTIHLILVALLIILNNVL